MGDNLREEILLKQIEIYSNEILNKQKAMYQALFGFITAIGVVASVMFGNNKLGGSINWEYLQLGFHR